MASAPNTTKKPATASATTSTWSAWLTNMTRPDVHALAALQRRLGAHRLLERGHLARQPGDDEHRPERGEQRRRPGTGTRSAWSRTPATPRCSRTAPARTAAAAAARAAPAAPPTPSAGPAAGRPPSARWTAGRSPPRPGSAPAASALAAAVTSALVVWPPNTTRQHRGDDHEAGQLGTGPRPRAPPATGRPRRRFSSANAPSTMASPPARRGQVGPHRPVQVDGAQHLADEHQRQQRHGAREHVAGGRVVLDEQRQARRAGSAARRTPCSRPRRYSSRGGGRRRVSGRCAPSARRAGAW